MSGSAPQPPSIDAARFADLKPFIRFSARGVTDTDIVYADDPSETHLKAWNSALKLQPDIFYDQLSWGMRNLSARKTEAMLEWRLRKNDTPLLILELWAEDTPLADRRDRNTKDRLMRLTLEFKGKNCTCLWQSFADEWPDAAGKQAKVDKDRLVRDVVLHALPAFNYMGVTQFTPFRDKKDGRDEISVPGKTTWEKARPALKAKFDTVVQLQQQRGHPLSPAVRGRLARALGANPMNIFDVAATGYSIARPEADAKDRNAPRVSIGDYMMEGVDLAGHYPLTNSRWLPKLGSPILLRAAQNRFRERMRIGRVPDNKAMDKALEDIKDLFGEDIVAMDKVAAPLGRSVDMLLGHWQRHQPPAPELRAALLEGRSVYKQAQKALEECDADRLGRRIGLEGVAGRLKRIYTRIEQRTGINLLFVTEAQAGPKATELAQALTAHYDAAYMERMKRMQDFTPKR